ncbi:PUA-like domain-containing protein [Mucidula mucida]|nr:PUA-like domain-containing protein [Mucidula mucida]
MPAISAIEGHIPGYPPGSKFDDRVACCHAGVHGHSQAGIHSPNGKARSITLSGRYEDDRDWGTYFIYTGEGGRKDRKEVQDEDQAWCKGNQALMNACKNRLAIRVIRRYDEGKSHPTDKGYCYRYDGLYVITHAWRQKGKQHKLMCRFLFQKLKNQNSLKWGPDDVEPYNADECHVPPGTDPNPGRPSYPLTSTHPHPHSPRQSHLHLRPASSSVPAKKPPARPQLSAAANKVPLHTGMKRPSPDSLCDRPMKKPTWVPPPDESCDRLLRRANLPPKPV